MEALVSTLYYAYCNSNLEPGQVERVIASNLDPAAREVIVSTAQRLFNEGLEQGLEQGEARMVLGALRYRFGELPESVRARVVAGSAGQREAWLKRLFVAQTLDEVFTE